MRCRAAIAWIVVVGLTSACAAIPSSGPVEQVIDERGLGESTVRYTPARPVPGASPEEIVRGYLDAMLAFPASSRTAAAFLTASAAKEWKFSTRVSIYSEPQIDGSMAASADHSDPQADDDSSALVRLDFVEEAQLDQQGHYTPRGTDASLSFRLARVDGQWRIANPPDGLLINSKFFEDYYRGFNLYYFDLPGQRLVPDPVHVVVGDQLAAALLTGLARGPHPDDGVVRSYLPEFTTLRPSVPVSGQGVADVEFAENLNQLSGPARDRLSAQIVWTLRQVPEVSAVQIVGGATSLAAGGREVQPISSWSEFASREFAGHGFAVVDDAVVQIDGDEVSRISGTWGTDAGGAVDIAVHEEGVAGRGAGGDTVRVTDREGAAARNVSGTDFLAPHWDADGALWLIDRQRGGTRVRILVGDDDPRLLAADGLDNLSVVGFAVSPDGGRYVVETREAGGTLYVGRVRRDAEDQVRGLGEPSRLVTTARNPRSVSWASGTTLRFLAQSASGLQVYEASIDGSSTQSVAARGGPLLPSLDARSLAFGLASASDSYVLDAEGSLWYLATSGSWRQVDAAPATGLTYGR